MTSSALLREAAANLYRNCGQFPFRFAKGKLRHDPVVMDVLSLDCLSRGGQSPARLLDLGCGQGLLFAALDVSLRYCSGPLHAGALPAMPSIAYARGYDVMPANVRWGQSMLANRREPCLAAQIEVADVRTLKLPVCDVVVVIDVLHYMAFSEQEMLLRNICDALVPGGRLVLRVGDAGQLRANRISRWVDRAVASVRGRGWKVLWMRPLSEWQRVLQRHGFTVTQVKTYRSWGAVNVLVLADKYS